MKQNIFRTLLLLIVISPIVALSFSALTGQEVLILGILFSSLAAIYLSRDKSDNPKDENRIQQISQKASWISFIIIVPSFAFMGAVFIVMGHSSLEKELTFTQLGVILACISQGILVLYTLFYIYFNREYINTEYAARPR